MAISTPISMFCDLHQKYIISAHSIMNMPEGRMAFQDSRSRTSIAPLIGNHSDSNGGRYLSLRDASRARSPKATGRVPRASSLQGGCASISALVSSFAAASTLPDRGRTPTMPTSRRNLPGLLFLRRRALRASVPVNALRFPCAQSCARRSTDVTGYSRVYLVQHVRGEPPAITPASSSGQSFMHSLQRTFLTERCCFVRVSWEVRRLDHRCGERRTNAPRRAGARRAIREHPGLLLYNPLRVCVALCCTVSLPNPSPAPLYSCCSCSTWRVSSIRVHMHKQRARHITLALAKAGGPSLAVMIETQVKAQSYSRTDQA